MQVDTSSWSLLGDTGNTRYFEIEPEIIVALPQCGSIDDAPTAAENVAFQTEHWRRRGHGGALIVFMDRLSSQDREARRLYQEVDPRLTRATALVGATLLGRAVSSFFFGLSKPKMPVKLFGDLDQALTWARAINAAAAGSGPLMGDEGR